MSGAGVRVRLPAPLQVLAGVPVEVTVPAAAPVCQRSVLDALEQEYPALLGTVRDRVTGRRRAFIRFFVHELDLSDARPDEPLPPEVQQGREPFVIVGAMSGG